jgi:hypothetical protein
MITEREDILIKLINAQSGNQSEKLKPSSTVDRKESYPYIPYHIDILFEQLLFIKDKIIGEQKIPAFDCYKQPAKGKFKFIDYGAGTGLNMYLATILGFESHGIEIDEETMKKCGFDRYSHLNFVKGDLNDKSLYKKDEYDIVFFYSPFHDKEKELNFELEAIKTLKIGGYLIAPHPGVFADFFNHRNNNYTVDLKSKKSQNFYNQMKRFEKINIISDYSPMFKRIK